MNTHTHAQSCSRIFSNLDEQMKINYISIWSIGKNENTESNWTLINFKSISGPKELKHKIVDTIWLHWWFIILAYDEETQIRNC